VFIPIGNLLDFLLRVVFFAVAPLSIVYLATLFSVTGSILNVIGAVVIFVLGDRARLWASRSKFTAWLLEEALAFEGYYRARAPRPFLYYLFYPALFPYWLFVRDARREFLVFRGYTISGLFILLATFVWQYFARYQPELGLKEFLPHMGAALSVEMLLSLSLLFPLATSFIHYHSRGQYLRLFLLLTVGIVSSTAAITYVTTFRDPVVSLATIERVTQRTKANRRQAHHTLLAAVRTARNTLNKSRSIEGDGKVTGESLEAARAVLRGFYKSDEALAFDVWASPRKRPRAIVLYAERRNQLRPIWIAVDGFGDEIRRPDSLPRGAFQAMRQASDGTSELLEYWPDALEPSIPK
jgi:hypothetical protein